MPHPTFSIEEIARRGEELYERSIRTEVEDKFDGKIVVMDIESGDYEVADATLPAADLLKARHPDAVLYTMRIGYEAVYGFGGGPRHVKH